MFYRVIRFFLFLFDPEYVHGFASYLVKLSGIFYQRRYSSRNSLGILMNHHELSGPVMMAAGFDKRGDLVNGLHNFGFSLTEVGTFTKTRQSGNPKPRLFRIPSQSAIFNRMGFNNPGIEKGLKFLGKSKHPFAISIGKSKDTPVEHAAEDYFEILKKIESFQYREVKRKIVYVAMNISSPNTPGLRQLQSKNYITKLIKQCKSATDLPLFVKFSPDFKSMKEYESVLLIALKAGINGIIVTNTTTDPQLIDIVPENIRNFGGGLSGLPLRTKSETILQTTLDLVKKKGYEGIPVISSGGVMSCEDVWRRLEMGASAVQMYTGYIYNGPGFAGRSLKYIKKTLHQQGFQSLKEFLSRQKAL